MNTQEIYTGDQGDEHIEPYRSSVPEEGFERPQTPSELFELAGRTVDILCRVCERLTGCEDAWTIVNAARTEVLHAHSWILEGKWLGFRRSAA